MDFTYRYLRQPDWVNLCPLSTTSNYTQDAVIMEEVVNLEPPQTMQQQTSGVPEQPEVANRAGEVATQLEELGNIARQLKEVTQRLEGLEVQLKVATGQLEEVAQRLAELEGQSREAKLHVKGQSKVYWRNLFGIHKKTSTSLLCSLLESSCQLSMC